MCAHYTSINYPMDTKTLLLTIRASHEDVSREMFLEALNAGDIFVRMHRSWIEQLRLEGEKGLRSPSAAAYRTAAKKFRADLCSQVDEWINTGRTSEGMEIPANRSVDAPQEDLIVGEMRSETHPLLRAFCLLESVLFTPMCLGKDGGFEIGFAPYGALSEPADLDAFVEEEAARFFVWFFASEWRHTIVKCRKCGLYYFIRNPTRLYKRGTYCQRHSAAKSAQVITARKRREKRNLLLRLAREAYRHLKDNKETPAGQLLNDEVTNWINKRTPTGMKSTSPKSPISSKWVTRNFGELRLR
jgi:hypothetical protein